MIITMKSHFYHFIFFLRLQTVPIFAQGLELARANGQRKGLEWGETKEFLTTHALRALRKNFAPCKIDLRRKNHDCFTV